MSTYKIVVLCLLISSSCFAKDYVYRYQSITLTIPDEWKADGNTFDDANGHKIAELTSKKLSKYSSGEEFISSEKTGYESDVGSIIYISSGVSNGIYWSCSVSDYEGSNGEAGKWYPLSFWVKGTILTIYSHKSCNEKFSKSLKIAKSVQEN